MKENILFNVDAEEEDLKTNSKSYFCSKYNHKGYFNPMTNALQQQHSGLLQRLKSVHDQSLLEPLRLLPQYLFNEEEERDYDTRYNHLKNVDHIQFLLRQFLKFSQAKYNHSNCRVKGKQNKRLFRTFLCIRSMLYALHDYHSICQILATFFCGPGPLLSYMKDLEFDSIFLEYDMRLLNYFYKLLTEWKDYFWSHCALAHRYRYYVEYLIVAKRSKKPRYHFIVMKEMQKDYYWQKLHDNFASKKRRKQKKKLQKYFLLHHFD